ncbi:MAG: hypothetical protein Q9163_005109 [Psora crenata]
MSTLDFAAAQQRIATRRQNREIDAQSRLAAQEDIHSSSGIARLPYPIGGLGRIGLRGWDAIKGREGTRPAFRIGQVDAELLDEELLELLRAQVGEALKYYGSHLRVEWSSEILFGLRAVLFKLSIWDHDASYGAALQNLRYTDARKAGPVHSAPTAWQKALYGLLTVGGRYGWEKWEDWLIDREGDSQVSTVRTIGHEPDCGRKTHRLQTSANVRFISKVSRMLATTHSIAAFASFLVFLVNGRYRTLLDRLLRMRLAPSSHQIRREVSFEYLNRQLVWHAFTEFLLFLLPLVGISRWRRWISRAWRKTKNFARNGGETQDDASRTGELAFLPERTCAICYQDLNPTSTSENDIMAVSGASGGVVGSAQTDITNPYETVPCACIYCFVCVATKLEAEEGEGWICLRCGEIVKECKPWSGDVWERERTVENKNTVSFSDKNGSSDMGGNREVEKQLNGSLTFNASGTGLLGEEHKSDWAEDNGDFGADLTSG